LKKEATQSAVLETKNLSRTVEDKVLLHDLSVQVQVGEVVTVVGPSRSGKSSFLRLLNRITDISHEAVLMIIENESCIFGSEGLGRAGLDYS